MIQRRSLSKLPQTVMLCDRLLDQIRAPEEESQKKQIQILIKENASLGGHANGYRCNGALRLSVSIRLLKGEVIPEIHPQLRQEAEHLEQLGKKLELDMTKLRHGLSTILTRCHSTQDFRDVLPEPLVRAFPDLRTLERRNAEGFLLNQFPMMREQFQRVVDIVLYYTTNRLFD